MQFCVLAISSYLKEKKNLCVAVVAGNEFKKIILFSFLCCEHRRSSFNFLECLNLIIVLWDP